MAVVTGDRYLESLVKFVEKQAGALIDGTLVLKLNPVGLHYVQSRFEALAELEGLLAGAPVDYLRAYVSDLGDHRALEQLRRILRLLTSLKVVSVLPAPARDPTPVSLWPFGRLKVLELRGCDLSTSAARGLLELRHTLEKIICHNSTDALRHIFASRIAEIKDSPHWNRLSFVSCACNGLVLMDESLQLLPVVETLDLSRNKFAKVDYLRKCTRLKHLDLGFNHLRTIVSLSEVSCQIVKLVLRNNAISTLHGIENLKSLEGLDLSYNLISNFSELEILSGLQSLQSLWLEGNPLSCARWYRAHVFSFFRHPDKVELDEKRICTREFWKSQIIIASRQKRPASFGFYSPAKDDAELEGTINTKRKKHSRLASIECEEQAMQIGSDQDSVSCENETLSKENDISDEETEIVGLMNRIEDMKKERSALWLLEFKDWLDQESENFMDKAKYNASLSNPEREHNPKLRTRQRHHGESSRYVSDSFQASGDESSMNILESDSSFADNYSVLHARQYFDRINEAASKFSMEHTSRNSVSAVGKKDLKQEQLNTYPNDSCFSIGAGNYYLDPLAIGGAEKIDANNKITPKNAIVDIMESRSPSICPGSPPHYQQDILHRRNYLEEEFLQLSAKSYSVASSDSDTSLSEDDFTKFGSFIPEGDQSKIEEFSDRSGHLSRHQFEERHNKGHEVSPLMQNGVHLSASYAEQASGILASEHSPQLLRDNIPTSECDDAIVHCGKHEADWLERKNCRRKPKRRFILPVEEKNSVDGSGHPSLKLYGDVDNGMDRVEDERRREIHGSVLHSIDKKKTSDIGIPPSRSRNGVRIISGEVVVLLSSELKLYVLLINAANDGSGISLKLMGCHKIEDVREVLVGLGLQILRICMGMGGTYLFPTRSIHISRQLLCLLHSSDSDLGKQNFSTKSFGNLNGSLEQAQVEGFEKHLHGSSKMSLFQYSMVLFSRKNIGEDLWFPRSLFVVEACLVVCIEDVMQFGSLSEDRSPPYYSLHSSCSIADVSEMVIDTREIWCLTLSLEQETSEFCASQKVKVEEEDATLSGKRSASASSTWKLKWFSEDSLFNFVAILKAIHAATANPSSPLLVRCIS
ncbi:uncharacterized protein LOC131311901 isoform X5 [Rhododendron vialii]|uniref:uncharacterized protein LOC131311901 isoform X5 n=1 Tax=Rhododendron vialii TaxID=182163 RepID=UPI00265EF1D6|nr:uncharacterized protein LOC131311901 isoform X5 [Rhododendron vialii]